MINHKIEALMLGCRVGAPKALELFVDSEWDEPMRCRKKNTSPIGVPGNVGYVPPVWDDFNIF